MRPLDLSAVKCHRKENCVHYEACLDEASALLWPSFSCEGCRLFIAKTTKSVSHRRAATPLAWEI